MTSLPSASSIDTVSATLATNLSSTIVTGTLVETSPASNIYASADGAFVVQVVRITNKGSLAADDLTARVTSSQIDVTGALVDAVETTEQSLEFRTNALTNQGAQSPRKGALEYQLMGELWQPKRIGAAPEKTIQTYLCFATDTAGKDLKPLNCTLAPGIREDALEPVAGLSGINRPSAMVFPAGSTTHTYKIRILQLEAGQQPRAEVTQDAIINVYLGASEWVAVAELPAVRGKAASAKRRGFSMLLDFAADRQWHHTSAGSFFFSGPYYTHNAKFQYLTLGLPSDARLAFTVRTSKGTKFTQGSLPPAEVSQDLGFTGRLAAPAGQRDFLDPSDEGGKLVADLSFDDGGQLFRVAKTFAVKSRSVFWLATTDAPDSPGSPGPLYVPIVYRDNPAGEVTSDPDAAGTALLLREPTPWKDLFEKYLTVGGTLVSVGEGQHLDDGTFGGIQLPAGTVYAGFAAVEGGRTTTSGTDYGGGAALQLAPHGLWNLAISLKHCWTAMPSGPLPARAGPSVAATLAAVVTRPPGQGTVTGYEGLYVLEGALANNFTLGQSAGSVILTNEQLAPINDHLFSILPDSVMFLAPPFNGDINFFTQAYKDTQITAVNTWIAGGGLGPGFPVDIRVKATVFDLRWDSSEAKSDPRRTFPSP